MTGRFTNVAAALLVVLGLAEIVGDYADLPGLARVGKLSAASPYPRPFVPYGRLEFWRNDMRVRWQTDDGERGERRIDREVYAAIPGPHIVPVAYALPFTVAPVVARAYWEPLLVHGMCDEGVLARAVGARAPVRSFELEIANPGRAHPWSTVQTCR